MNGNDASVFISHSHSDRGRALRIRAVLDDVGVETFLDQERILGGDDLPESVAKGISEHEVFLLIWSAHAATSEWVDRFSDPAELRKSR